MRIKGIVFLQLLVLGGICVRGAPAHAKIICGSSNVCYATSMPLYDQLNPNFAKAKVSGSLWTKELAAAALPAPHTVPLAPAGVFQNTFLPYGPDFRDPGSLGAEASALCDPTSNGMAMVAAIYAASPGTTMVAGSWLATYFWDAYPYDGMADVGAPGGLPSPLDPATRGSMDWYDLQAVMNLADYRDMLVTGGCCGQWDKLPTFFGSWFTPTGAFSTSTISDANQNNTNIIKDIRAGYAMNMAISDYAIHINRYVTVVGSRSGPPQTTLHEDITFTTSGGHVMAINGYFAKTNPILVYDPWLATERWFDVATIKNGSYTSGTTIRTITLPDGRSAAGVLNGYYPGVANVQNVWNLVDGQTLAVLQGGGIRTFMVP